MAEPSDLAGLQRCLQTAIMDPDGDLDEAAQVLTASETLTARQRLAIYWRGYRLRLLENMRGLHPGLTHLLGEETFDRFALDYLDARPPSAYTLSRLDEGFAAHLSATRPDRRAPGTSKRPDWPDLIIDIARLERIITEVIEGPGTENADLPATDDLPEPADLPGLRPVVAPCLRLPRLAFPVHEYLTAVRRGEDPDPPAARPVRLAVHRRDYKVTMRELDPAAHRALRALAKGAAVGVAFQDVDAQAIGLLRRWIDLGFFSHLDEPADREPADREPADREPGSGSITSTRKGAR
ncbi:putative DNA-binding domain-containing protein [Actinomadura sp. 3N508]|uniref:HvfC/BufC family peptide modification chaperone n=1 Tax=Actinomadura sp. 3N508 TaxID=3375153 RepID=UPI00378ED92E